MSKFVAKSVSLGAVCIAVILSHCAHQGYSFASKTSLYESTASLLGFKGTARASAKEQQEALLKAFYYAGYLTPENLWQDINHLGFNKPNEVFLSIMEALVKSGASQSNSGNFDAKLLRKLLFKSNDISTQDALDLLLYIGQHAFNRVANQERNELTDQTWMEAYQTQYIVEAKKLNLVERVSPSYTSYDEAVILGAARVTVTTRVLDYLYNQTKGVTVKGDTFALAGQRPLWAEIDGISKNSYERLLAESSKGIKIEDINLSNGSSAEIAAGGVEYMLELAHKTNTEIDEDHPVIKYGRDDTSIPDGFRAGRTYLNYLEPGRDTLTETLMVYDVLQTLSTGNIEVVDTKSAADSARPNTATTAKDYADALIVRIKNGEFGDQTKFIIYVQSNQPYTERQALAVQRELDRAVKDSDINNLEIAAEGVGYGTKASDIKRIHSELGALISIKYQVALEKHNLQSTRQLGDLQFSTRDKSVITTKIPDYSHITTSNPLDSQIPFLGDIKYFFFEYFEEM